MDFITELKPNNIGKDQFRIVIVPFIVSLFYFAFLYIQSFIKESNNENAIGYTYSFKGYFSPTSAFPNANNAFIVIFLSIWVAIRTINLNGTIGNVGISAIIFGSVYSLLEMLFFLSYLNEISRPAYNVDFVISDYLRDRREFLVSNFLFNLLEFMFLSIIVAGVYIEVTKNFRQKDVILYPKA